MCPLARLVQPPTMGPSYDDSCACRACSAISSVCDRYPRILSRRRRARLPSISAWYCSSLGFKNVSIAVRSSRVRVRMLACRGVAAQVAFESAKA
jgi:hypothetical protein